MSRPKLAPTEQLNYHRFEEIVEYVLSENEAGFFPARRHIMANVFEVNEDNFDAIKAFGREHHDSSCWMYYSRKMQGYVVGDQWKDSTSGGVQDWMNWRVECVQPQLRNMVTAMEVAAPFNGRTKGGAIAKMIQIKLTTLLSEISVIEEYFEQIS